MFYPKITVVTPNYNQAQFIERTILSVLNQGYPNLEYIIIDGASTDGSVEIINKYSNQLACFISENDDGMYYALQNGFSKSTGDIMTYINSDDVLQPHSLFTVAEIFLKYPEISWVNGLPNQIDEYDRIVWVGNLPNWTKYHFFNKQYKYIQQEGCFWRRKLWDEAGSYISTKYFLASDLELWARFFQNSKLYYLPVALGSFRLRKTGQKSLNEIDVYNEEAQAILTESFFNASPADKKLINRFNSNAAKILRKFNSRYLFSIFSYSEIYDLYSQNECNFEFDRSTQSFKLIKK